MEAADTEMIVAAHGDRRSGDHVVILGASNVARGVQPIVQTLCALYSEPIHIYLAAGHGRSFSSRSRVLWRVLPGLPECGLWNALSKWSDSSRRSVLITDVGNDLIYGREVEQILERVEECLGRLNCPNTRRILMGLPMRSIRSLGVIRFWTARTILFPSSKLQFGGLVERCEHLNEGLATLAARYSATLISPDPSWYGLDPVHVRFLRQRDVWRDVLSTWNESDGGPSASVLTMRDKRSIRNARHAVREWFGKREEREQPSVILSNGTALSLY